METTQTTTPPLPEPPYRVTPLLEETQYTTRHGSLYVSAVWMPLVPLHAGVPRGATYFYASTKKRHPDTFLGILTPHAPKLGTVPPNLLADLADRAYGKALKDAPATPETHTELVALARSVGACKQCAASTLGTTEGHVPPEGVCDHCDSTQVEPLPASPEHAALFEFMTESLESLTDDLVDWLDEHGSFPTRKLNVQTPLGVVTIDISRLSLSA